MVDPQISLNSFVLGFLFGCLLFSVMGTRSFYACVECTKRNSALPVPLVTSRALVAPRAATLVEQQAYNRSDAPPRLSLMTMARPRASLSAAAAGGCPDRPLKLVILILSAPSGVMRRNAIRGTWVHDSHVSRTTRVTTRFMVGTLGLTAERLGNLTYEQSRFGDMLLQENLHDSYSNLSTKVLLGLTWAHANLPYDYIIKTDDDSYVRIEKTVTAIRNMGCIDMLYWGYFMGYAFPEPTGKWAENNWFVCPHYLPYAMGGGYVLSKAAVNLALRYSHRLKVYSNEDVTVGSWFAPYRVHRKHDLRFDVESVSHGCNNHYIISHKERVRSFYEKYTSLVRNQTLCREEKEIRPGYEYDWKADSPLSCCKRTKGLEIVDDT